MRNPWQDQHAAHEVEFYTGGGYTARMARQVVAGEYASAPAPVPCDCGGTLHYKATVGALVCPTCGEVELR